MSCKNDENWDGPNIVLPQQCVLWNDLLQLRYLYNQVWDECNKYGIVLQLPTGRNKYGEPGHLEEIDSLATINGFFSIKMTGGESPQFEETKFIITGGSINDRIPAPNPDYEYAANDYGPWIVYLKSECYGCGGWELDRAGDHYPRYRCCYGNYCDDMDPYYWKSQNYVGRTTEGGICNFGREWGSDYMDMVEHCIALSPRFQCVCDDYPPCNDYRNECCQQDVMWHFSNFYDVLGPSGVTYGDPNCDVDALQCPTIYEKRGIKWIGSHEPSSGYQGYVTQVIKAKHLADIWTAIQPALSGQHRLGKDWYFCKGEAEDKKWGKDDTVNWEDFRYRFNSCQKCDAPPSGPICACHMNDLSFVLNKMLSNICSCTEGTQEWAGKDMWKIVADGTPSKEDCACSESCGGISPGKNVFEITKEEYDGYYGGGTWNITSTFVQDEKFNKDKDSRTSSGGGTTTGSRVTEGGCSGTVFVSENTGRATYTYTNDGKTTTTNVNYDIEGLVSYALGKFKSPEKTTYYVKLTGKAHEASSEIDSAPCEYPKTVSLTVDGNNLEGFGSWCAGWYFEDRTKYSNDSSSTLTATYSPKT